MNEIKYGFSRRIQLKNYIPSAHGFESAEFVVQGAETKKEAEKETMDWFKDYVDRNNKKVREEKDTRTDIEKFEDSLNKDVKNNGNIPDEEVDIKQVGNFMKRI